MLEGYSVKAIVLKKTCRADELKVSEVPIPEVKPDWVLVKVWGFGINRAEIVLREYEADEDYINLPVIPGIECVGEVVDPSNSQFSEGDMVVGLMGGMGRSFDGSYAEYALIPLKNVFKIPDCTFKYLLMEEIISIPETYFTAFGSIKSLKLKKEDTILIRGATSAAGLSAIQLADAIGATIIATTRNENKVEKLLFNRANYVVIDDGKIEDTVCEICPEGVDKVLEFVGPKTLEDSMKCLKKGGICCNTGILGGDEYISEFDPIKLIPNDRYLTSFFSNYPTQNLIDEIYLFIAENDINPNIGKVFTRLEDICDAHKLMESNNANGKIIFRLEK